MNYSCTVLFDASTTVEVEACNAAEAAAMAEDKASGSQNLCRECSDSLDTGDVYGVIAYDEDGVEVGDTRLTETLRKQDEALIRQLVDALEAMQSEAAAKSCGLRICDEAIALGRARLESKP